MPKKERIRVPVRMLYNLAPYNKGEIAGFSPLRVAKLLNAKPNPLAELVYEVDAKHLKDLVEDGNPGLKSSQPAPKKDDEDDEEDGEEDEPMETKKRPRPRPAPKEKERTSPATGQKKSTITK